MKITCTSGNRKNGIRGSRITIYSNNNIIDRFEVSKWDGVKYCNDYPNGKHGKRFFLAVEKAKLLEKNLEEGEMKNYEFYGDKEIETSYMGFDGITYAAKIKIAKHTNNYECLVYDYYDSKNDEWINTEERDDISQEEMQELYTSN